MKATTKKKQREQEQERERPRKRIRVTLSYVVLVNEDFPIRAVGADINRLISVGLLSYARSDTETILIEGGARLQLSALGDASL